MIPTTKLLLSVTFLAVSTTFGAPPTEGAPPPQKIAFGSCNVQHFQTPVWRSIRRENPDLLLLLGDNVYIDSHKEEYHRRAYQKLQENPSFRDVLKHIPILATWDDHDYGRNDNGGEENPQRALAQKIFLDAFQIPKNRAPHKRDGIYDSYEFGQSLQILVLDTRFFRDPLKKSPKERAPKSGRYEPDPNPTKTLLGPAQWAWLEEQLQKPFELRIVASSIQVLPNLHQWECWGNFPREREKLLSLLENTPGEILILSGDRHYAEISEKKTPTKPLWEVTSSPLNNSAGELLEKNPYRVGPPLFQRNYGLLEIHPKFLEISLKSPSGKTLQKLKIPRANSEASPEGLETAENNTPHPSASKPLHDGTQTPSKPLENKTPTQTKPTKEIPKTPAP